MASVTFENLYVSELPYVWHTLRRLGVDESTREDLAHEVFLVVHRRLGDFDAERPVRPWLFGICYRVVSAYRRSARVRREQLDADVGVGPGNGVAPDAGVLARDDRALVLAALAELPLDRRAVFILYELDAASMAEISEALAMPRNTGYSHLRRAREAFAAAVRRLRADEGGARR